MMMLKKRTSKNEENASVYLMEQQYEKYYDDNNWMLLIGVIVLREMEKSNSFNLIKIWCLHANGRWCTNEISADDDLKFE